MFTRAKNVSTAATHSLRAAVFAGALAAAAGVAGLAHAADVTVTDAWARASAGKAKAGGAFMKISNAGSEADRLVSAAADISERVELHTHIKDGDVMRMREVPHIEVPAGGMVMLQPGGYHVMFMGLHDALKEGGSFPLRLTFEKAGTVDVTVAVKGPGAMGGMDHGKMDHGKMKNMKKD